MNYLDFIPSELFVEVILEVSEFDILNIDLALRLNENVYAHYLLKRLGNIGYQQVTYLVGKYGHNYQQIFLRIFFKQEHNQIPVYHGNTIISYVPRHISNLEQSYIDASLDYTSQIFNSKIFDRFNYAIFNDGTSVFSIRKRNKIDGTFSWIMYADRSTDHFRNIKVSFEHTLILNGDVLTENIFHSSRDDARVISRGRNINTLPGEILMIYLWLLTDYPVDINSDINTKIRSGIVKLILEGLTIYCSDIETFNILENLSTYTKAQLIEHIRININRVI